MGGPYLARWDPGAVEPRDEALVVVDVLVVEAERRILDLEDVSE